MQSDVPKQFLLLQGKPILQHTIEQFRAYSATMSIIVVLPEQQLSTWADLCQQHQFSPTNVQTVIGGASRFQSVQNGLAAITAPAGLVAVHDGVRPFVTPALIHNSFETAARLGSAVTAVAANDSVRQVRADGSSTTLDRSSLRLIQTPQTFRLDWFRQAFQTPEQPHFTDCASVLEWADYPITLIEGDYKNIKITTPDDLR